MKNYILVTVLFFGSFFIAQNLFANSADIVINEIAAYPTSTHEWIEIWNRGDSDVDLTNWKFWENETNHGLSIINGINSIVSPGEFGIIAQNGDIFLQDYPNFIGLVFDSSWTSLNLSGEEIGLKDGQGNFVESFSYLPIESYSLERVNPYLNNFEATNWREHASGNTAGAQNSHYLISEIISVTNTEQIVTTTETSTSTEVQGNTTSTETESNNMISTDWSFIKLNEIIADPNDGNEMIELYNSGSTTVDVTGGSICDTNESGCKILSGQIFGHDWLVADLMTSRYLNNSGDRVMLKNGANELVDDVTYGTDLSAAIKGQSLIRKNDGVDSNSASDWSVTTKITLGASNEIVLPIVNTSNSGGSASVNSITQIIIPTATTTAKTIKISTTTVVDLVKIVWSLDVPYGLDVNESGSFSAEGSADPRGGELHYLWNFGNGTTSKGREVVYSYATSGIYFGTLTVSSTAGTNGKKEFKIFVGETFSVAKSNLSIIDWDVTSTEELVQYILVKNNLDKSQDISGWKLKNSRGKEYKIPENTIINSSSTLKFYRAVTHLSFDKDGDNIKLTSPNDKEIAVINIFTKETKKAKQIKTAAASSKLTWLKMRGIVTAPPATFGVQYFYIFDGLKGIQVYNYKKDFPELELGDEVLVQGELSEINGIKRIKIKNKSAVDILSTEQVSEPINLNLEEISDELLGALVKTSGDITEIKTNYMYVDNGDAEIVVYFKKGAKINKRELKEGDKINVTGILESGKNGWQILPRSIEDIEVTGFSDEVLEAQIEASKNEQRDVAEKYLTATAGGLTTLLLGLLGKARGTLLVSGTKKAVSLAARLIRRG